jgi:hypothetical protein
MRIVMTNDIELPGMWEHADFMGGGTDAEDCPTCKYTQKADCLAPEYMAMTYDEKQIFWRDPTPCSLWVSDALC